MSIFFITYQSSYKSSSTNLFYKVGYLNMLNSIRQVNLFIVTGTFQLFIGRHTVHVWNALHTSHNEQIIKNMTKRPLINCDQVHKFTTDDENCPLLLYPKLLMACRYCTSAYRYTCTSIITFKSIIENACICKHTV